MLNFILCDDEANMLNRLSLLFEKSFMQNDFDAQIVLKTSNYKEVISFMSKHLVNVVVLDIEFKNLGLIVIDEEQRFGVKHKETLKKLRLTTKFRKKNPTPKKSTN